MSAVLAVLAAVVVGTWNGNWFPSGRAKHHAPAAVEAATVDAAAKMLADGLRAVDPLGTNDVILCLNEIRGPRVASNLVARIGRKGLSVAVVTAYRWSDRFDWQQDVIATTLPVAEAHWSRWKGADRVCPPRGYAFAAVVVDPATTARVYAVHLKSNYGATKPQVRAENRLKRTLAVNQLVAQERPPKRKRKGFVPSPVIVAGDLNADCWKGEFADETIFASLADAGFSNALAFLPAEGRVTRPSPRFGDSALDYVFVRGLEPAAPPTVFPCGRLSDHRPVFVPVW